ncbi:MAG: hypothetical protein P8Z49_01870 [Acidobacteriota bacterium]|jgi:hypothetical protein
MVKKIAACIVLVLAAGLSCRAAGPDGFGPMKWGQAVPGAWQLVGGDTGFRLPVYTDPAGTTRYGKARIQRAEYEFRDGKLARVVIYVKGKRSVTAVRDELVRRFGRKGEPARPLLCRETLVWKSEKTFASLNDMGDACPGLLLLASLSEQPPRPHFFEWEMERKIHTRLKTCRTLLRKTTDMLADIDRQLASVQGGRDALPDPGPNSQASCIGLERSRGESLLADRERILQSQRVQVVDQQRRLEGELKYLKGLEAQLEKRLENDAPPG